MSDLISLPAQKRERAGKGAARAVRRQGLVPGVIYGDKQPAVLIQMDPRPLMAQLNKPGFYAHQYELDVDGEKFHVMAQDVQYHVVTDAPQHVDFLRVSANTLVTTEIPVEFVNNDKAPGLKRGGVLTIVRHSIEVVGKPDALPDSLVCDLTGADIGDSVHASSVTFPAGVKATITDRDFTVATIAAPSGLKSEMAEGEGA
ncbi:50S ribosomal protein L25/general stress protein Ctc [Novispirillum sp. DQ9]|uniref:50S ribosomal protein L25/general stress protein Ctc n=1 Tax=Novispirillum sp. DQ9 TaxID=3398612 RepID=UPI003C7E8345